MIIAIEAISAKYGGIYTYTKNLIESLQKFENHHFHFWVPLNTTLNSYKNIHIHQTPAADYGILKRILYQQIIFRKEIKDINPDLLFSSASFGLIKPFLPQLLLIREPGPFSILFYKHIYPKLTPKDKIVHKLRRHLMGISAKNSNMVMYPSTSMKNSVLDFYPSLEKKSRVNLYGAPEKKFQLDNDHIPNNTSHKSINLLYVSAYYAHKNPSIIGKALKILLQKGWDIKARITMNMDAPHETNVITWKEEINILTDKDIVERIVLKSENYDSIQKLYKQSDIFVFPSYIESFGHPMLEAMKSGIPIIAADTEINREICGEAAIYFPPFDEEELANQILDVKKDESLRKKMIDKGFIQSQKFLWDDHVTHLVELFEELYTTHQS
ncbi:MAG: glycosyltransferase family 4 protein [Ignavibacteriales bacterium]|nr:glycosyltransferase family 4 protein [Ignavibacteriales bacterium]